MKYVFTFITLTACGVFAASPGEDSSAIDTTAAERGKSSGEKIAENSYSQPALTGIHDHDNAAGKSPIPALILPNNVCVINTDLSPDRTIEEHILACVRAQRIRRRS